MRLGVVGSRYFTDRNYFEDVILEVLEKFNIEHFVSGGAKGADTLIQEFCKRKGLSITIYYPAWEDYGKSAGPIRNKVIVKNIDILLAFFKEGSKGTRNIINIAESQHVPVIRVNLDKHEIHWPETSDGHINVMLRRSFKENDDAYKMLSRM